MFFFFLFKVAPAAYGSSQARGRIGATAADLCHSHSNARAKLHLCDPCHSLWQHRILKPGIKPASSRIIVRFLTR